MPSHEDGLAFFVDQLGFEVIEDTDMGGGKRWVRVAPRGAQTQFLLACAVGDQRAHIGQQGGRRVWLFLHTDDFARDHAAMCAAGVTFAEAPRHEAYGTVVVLTDPFGNRWDLIEPAATR